MAAIKCDICGGSLSMDSSGDFATCDSCGMKHTKDRVKAMAMEVTGTVAVSNIAGVESLMKRGNLALEDSKWKEANEYFEKVLDIDAEYAPAYFGKLCSELKISNEVNLTNHEELLENIPNFKKALRFADADYRAKLDEYNQSTLKHIHELKIIRERNSKYHGCVSGGDEHTVGLKTDGTVVVVGRNQWRECNVNNWRDVVAISAGEGCTVGLKADGTVITTGLCSSYWCDNWCDIVAISYGYEKLVVGLKANGTVVAESNPWFKFEEVKDWRGIVAISTNSDNIIAGLKGNGKVVLAVDDEWQRENRDWCDKIRDWCDIVAISGRSSHIVGLKADGTVVAVGKNDYGQCNTSNWCDIIAVSAGYGETVGLKANGTIVAVGISDEKQCKISDWRDIVAISAEGGHTVGLKADGTVVAAGCNDHGQCNTSSWHNIGPVVKNG
jgi:hypothetical protein